MIYSFQLAVLLILILILVNRLAKTFLLVFSFFPKNNLDLEIKTNRNDDYQPNVAIHVAISNENPQIVIKTLSELLKLDYPNYIVMVIDNNTSDKNLWMPVKKYCDGHSSLLKFHHVENLRGYKAGALKYALNQTPDNVEFIAIVDSDNIVNHAFLKNLVRYFRDPKVAFVQTPLGFRQDPSKLRFQSWIFIIYRYFLSIYMPATNRFGRAPFIGSMGIIRRTSLEKAGGWNGFYLTEDMELSYRIFANGETSRFIDHSYGFSMPPYDIVNFKKQHFRWNFGNTQILRDYFFNIFYIRHQTIPGFLNKFIYFSCPGIYINFYYLPFCAIVFFVYILNSFGYHIELTRSIFSLINAVLLIEITGEFIIFVLLGHKEHINLMTLLKNYASWWGLSINNCLSTYAALLKPTHVFQITSKTSNVDDHTTKGKLLGITVELYVFFGILIMLIASPLLPMNMGAGYWVSASILGAMSACNLLLARQ